MQEEIPGLSLANVLDDAAAEDSLPFVAEGSTGENRSDSFPRSPPESVDNDSCHISGSAACQWHGHGLSFEEECHRVGTQQDSSLRLFQQVGSRHINPWLFFYTAGAWSNRSTHNVPGAFAPAALLKRRFPNMVSSTGLVRGDTIAASQRKKPLVCGTYAAEENQDDAGFAATMPRFGGRELRVASSRRRSRSTARFLI